jgi:voltage-gated potassium channel
MIRQYLQNRLFNVETETGRNFGLAIGATIILSTISFSIETVPYLEEAYRVSLSRFELITVAIFSIEYLARLYAAPARLKFAFSFYGLIDLVAILPYFLMGGLDLRAVRIFRLLRLFRILKLLRYKAAARRFLRALKLVREELILFSVISVMLVFVAAVGIYYFEHAAQPEHFRSIFDALWWAVSTLTTVGYGDIYPITTGGRLFTFLVLVVGLGVIAVPTGLVASALSQARSEEKEKNHR